jgi:APA family basic amino acid/polyamine antiporter
VKIVDQFPSVVPSPKSLDVPRNTLARELRARDGFAIVAGSVIGSGIFLVPGAIAKQLSSLRCVLLVWVVGGLLSLFGALSLAEMGSMLPAAGGLYSYLREAYGKPVGFLYGWATLAMIQTGSIATLAAGFGLYVSQLIFLSPQQEKLVCLASVVALTAVNLMSLRESKLVQNIVMAAKLIGIAALGAMLFARGHAATLGAGWEVSTHAGFLAYGPAVIAVLWSYEGWHVVSFTASEFRNPQKDLPRSLISGIYVMLNIAYYSVLLPGQLVGTGSAAASAIQSTYGGSATRLVSLLILTSILGAMNGMILTGPRVYYAMARDGVFFASLGKTTARSKVPALAIVVQGVWASVLTVAGTFQQLFTYVIFTGWIFYGLAVFGVVIFRHKFPQQTRPFRTPGYPVVPILFVMAAAGVALSAIVSQPKHAAIGIAFILVGLPLYFVFRTYSPVDSRTSDLPELEV